VQTSQHVATGQKTQAEMATRNQYTVVHCLTWAGGPLVQGDLTPACRKFATDYKKKHNVGIEIHI